MHPVRLCLAAALAASAPAASAPSCALAAPMRTSASLAQPSRHDISMPPFRLVTGFDQRARTITIRQTQSHEMTWRTGLSGRKVAVVIARRGEPVEIPLAPNALSVRVQGTLAAPRFAPLSLAQIAAASAQGREVEISQSVMGGRREVQWLAAYDVPPARRIHILSDSHASNAEHDGPVRTLFHTNDILQRSRAK